MRDHDEQSVLGTQGEVREHVSLSIAAVIAGARAGSTSAPPRLQIAASGSW